MFFFMIGDKGTGKCPIFNEDFIKRKTTPFWSGLLFIFCGTSSCPLSRRLLNAHILQNGSEGLDEFINYANTLIRQYRPMVGQKPTPSPDESLEEGLEDEEIDGDIGGGSVDGPTTGPTNPGGSTGGSEEGPTDGSKVLLLFNDGAHGNVVVKRMEVAPGYQLSASDLPEGYVYAFKADDQADLDAAGAGDTVWVTLAPRG